MVVIRFLFALLLGFVIGAGTTLWLVHSEAGDLVIRRTEVVQDLERRLREVEDQRDKLGRQADDFARRFERMEGAFNDLEKRYRTQAEEEQPARGGQHDAGEKPAAQP